MKGGNVASRPSLTAAPAVARRAGNTSAPPPTLDALLDLHSELCVDSRSPTPGWFRRCRDYDLARRTMEREGVNVELAVLKRFMSWASPDEVATAITPRR